jgi:hypothetical protein
MQEDINIADIQQSLFEYRTGFKDPIMDIWYGGRHGELISAVQKALSPWGVGLENIVWSQSPKNLGEVQVTFGVPSMIASIQVGIGGVTMNALNPDWSRVSQFISLFQTGVNAVTAAVGQDLQAQQTTLGFHIKPGAKPFREILGGFVNAQGLGSDDAAMFGVSVYYSDFIFVIDKSVMFPEGVFVRLIRTFSAAARFEEMAARIYKDEETVLHRLGLKLQ